MTKITKKQTSTMIGLETHVYVNTKSKLFCSCSTQEEKPNKATCAICLGFPGSKPSLNAKAVELTIQAGIALNCKIANSIEFSRKIYYYPDLAKNFQITQYDNPIASKGSLLVGDFLVEITRAHLEEDPAKIVHKGSSMSTSKASLLDFNRSGCPLIEIVTEPCFTTAKQAREYLGELFRLLAYLEIVDAKSDAVMKTDVNVSIPGGVRVEIKNVTGFANVERAINGEINRQTALVNTGHAVEKETRMFDAETSTSTSIRKKETEEEYAYINEPDIPSIALPQEYVESVRQMMPVMPKERVKLLVLSYSLNSQIAKSIVDFPGMATYFEDLAVRFVDKQLLARWLANYVAKSLNYQGIEKLNEKSLSKKNFLQFMQRITSGETHERRAKEEIKKLIAGEKLPVAFGEKINEDEIIKEVIRENKKATSDYKAGNKKALDFLIGQVMRKSKAQIKVETARQKLNERLA